MGERAALEKWPWAVRLHFAYEDGKRYCKFPTLEIVSRDIHLANNEIILSHFEIQCVEDP